MAADLTSRKQPEVMVKIESKQKLVYFRHLTGPEKKAPLLFRNSVNPNQYSPELGRPLNLPSLKENRPEEGQMDKTLTKDGFDRALLKAVKDPQIEIIDSEE